MAQSSRITSRQNPQVKNAVRLRDGHERRQRGQFIIDGLREISRAIDSDVHPLRGFVCDELCKSDECQRIKAKVASDADGVLQVSADGFAKLAFGDRADGVLVVA